MLHLSYQYYNIINPHPATPPPQRPSPISPMSNSQTPAATIPPLTQWFIPTEGQQACIGFNHPDGSGFVAVLDVTSVGGYLAPAIAKELLSALRFAGRAQEKQPEVERLLNWSRPMGTRPA